MLCKCHWIVSYTVHFTAFCRRGPFLSGHGVVKIVLYGFSAESDKGHMNGARRKPRKPSSRFLTFLLAHTHTDSLALDESIKTKIQQINAQQIRYE